MSTQMTPNPPKEESPLKQLTNPNIVMLVTLTFLIGLAVGYIIWGNQTVQVSDPQTAQAPTPETMAAEDQEPSRFEVSVDDDPSIGPTNAPVTIIEFSDFACGYCRRFQQQTLYQLMAAYPDQILFVYRDLPVVGGMEAAQAAECADEQGSFWPYHDKLFSGELTFGRSAYLQYAADLNLDSDQFSECLDSGRYAEEVTADARYAMNLGINATPTFFINGFPLIGAYPFEEFAAIIESELGE